MKRMKVLVNVTVPDEVSPRMIRTYVKDAVSSWGGQLHPKSPLSSYRDKHVTTKMVRKWQKR